MQDFDFGKYYKNNGNSFSGNRSQSKQQGPAWTRKLSIFGAVISIAFFTGMYTGIHVKNTKVVENITPNTAEQIQGNSNILSGINHQSANVSNVNVKKIDQTGNTHRELTDKLQSKDAEFIILAKMYSSKEKAHYHGLQLQKQGFPVFLAENGSKMKLYVGPISGKKQAYSTLAQVKGVTEFKSAIMYKK